MSLPTRKMIADALFLKGHLNADLAHEVYHHVCALAAEYERLEKEVARLNVVVGAGDTAISQLEQAVEALQNELGQQEKEFTRAMREECLDAERRGYDEGRKDGCFDAP